VRQVCYQGGYVLHLRACRQSRHRLLRLRQCRWDSEGWSSLQNVYHRAA
jgi:hypothetical protein